MDRRDFAADSANIRAIIRIEATAGRAKTAESGPIRCCQASVADSIPDNYSSVRIDFARNNAESCHNDV